MGQQTSNLFSYKEDLITSPGAVRKGDVFCSIQVPPELTKRRIYAYAELFESVIGTATYIKAKIQCLSRSTVLQEFPLEIMNDAYQAGVLPTPYPKSFVSFIGAGGNVRSNSIVVKLVPPFGTAQVILQPSEIVQEMDAMQIIVTEVLAPTNLQATRFIIGCVSH